MQPETLFTIVACGQSAENWIPRGHTIGVNDAWKWGKPTDSLLVCNRPQEFTKERLQVITSSTPKTFYSHKSNWAYAFPEWKKLPRMENWGTTGKYLMKDRTYYSDTSSFIAISLAHNLGAKDIILWGVDMMNHWVFNSNNPYRDKEVGRHMELIEALKGEGVSVWLGKEGTAFDDKLKIYDRKETIKAVGISDPQAV